jgi:FtsP/CotA-like multicopper oxidase with cupredoxin domain
MIAVTRLVSPSAPEVNRLAKEWSRRRFIASAGACAGTTLLPGCGRRGGPGQPIQSEQHRQQPVAAIRLQATMRTLEVDGKAASIMGLSQPDGTQGLTSAVNHPFKVLLENRLPVPTAIHWHGLHPPNNQDGVPGVTQLAIRPDASTLYDFPLRPAGTHWMHSHLGLQEAFLLSAPLIVHDPADQTNDEQEVVLFLGDFSFTPPKEIFARLRGAGKPASSVRGAKPMVMPGKSANPAGMKMAMGKPDANDWNYDAYLANDRTLHDPAVVKVERSGRVRLRIINGSSGTNFFVDLGALRGELIATDGMPVRPVQGSRFPLAIAQRIDLRMQLPAEGGAFPILALREGATEQTGVILATAGARIPRLPVKHSIPAGLLTLDLESRLVAAAPLVPRAVDQSQVLRLQGNMSKYEWSINDVVFNTSNPAAETPQVRVKPGQRVALSFVNETGMSHPMHLHGHSFQVTEINGRALQGALRDTVLVPPRSAVTVAFDANNPGLWYVHCHVLWHLAAGMATLVQYDA